MIPIRLLPILLAAVPTAKAAPDAQDVPPGRHPLPYPRDGVCGDSCHMYADGCSGACEMLRHRLAREVRAVTPDVAAAAREAEAAKWRMAEERKEEKRQREAHARLAATPDKTLRRRARGGDVGAQRELARREGRRDEINNTAPVGADAGRDPGREE